ncbi:ABC transporter permease [Curtobacterium sp. RRHDQ10]|uniref:ABC transporter permease n=1 Tax=Curtobacterium phyllosphaerae TaxID=3413379 RepID=UPI003BF2C5F3
MRALTFLVGSVSEAWSEFRTHKTRVLMSLIGVGLAVLALTSVAAVSAVAQQSVTEGLERQSGRPALLSIGTPYQPDATNAVPVAPPAGFGDAIEREMSRYDIDYASRNVQFPAEAQGQGGTVSVSLQAVDRDYATMHRLRLVHGAWFGAHDAARLAPAVIVDEAWWKDLGSPDLRTHPTIALTGPSAATAVIVGVTPGGFPGSPSAIMLYDAVVRLAAGTNALDPSQASVQYEAWVPPASARALSSHLSNDLSEVAGDGWQVDVQRVDYKAYPGPDPLLLLKIVVGGAAGLILVLGALGLVNISLVTIRTRVREIGIRRSFGATASRVFVAIMLESVVATAIAGIAGVAVSILALKNPLVTGWLHEHGVISVPAFPASASLLGLAVAVGVGALAGLLPAIIAVRVKPIDAIRF